MIAGPMLMRGCRVMAGLRLIAGLLLMDLLMSGLGDGQFL